MLHILHHILGRFKIYSNSQLNNTAIFNTLNTAYSIDLLSHTLATGHIRKQMPCTSVMSDTIKRSCIVSKSSDDTSLLLFV